MSDAQIQTLSEAVIHQRLRALWPISSAGCAPRIGTIMQVYWRRSELELRRAAQEAPRPELDRAGDTANEPRVSA
jgi:hypothetical protein